MARKTHPLFIVFLALMALMLLAGMALLIWGSTHPSPVTPLRLWHTLARWPVHG